MKGKYRTYFYLITIIFGFLLLSCDREDNISVKNIEGHWVYAETKAEVYVTDLSLKKSIEDYIGDRHKAYRVSYEFKNDKTYYYYQNFAEPHKGIYKIIDKNYFEMDDVQGEKTAVREDSLIYVISDLKEDVIRNLKIDRSKILEAKAIDVFKRGLIN